MDLIWMFMGSLVYFIYQLKLMHYSAKILADPYENSALYILFATINTIFLIMFYATAIPHYFFYPLAFLALTIEFMLMSRAGFLQSVTGAAIFVLNITVVNIPITMIYSQVNNFFPLYAVLNTTHRSIVLLICCVVLFLMLITFELLVPATNVQRITSAGKYTVMLLFVIIGSLTFEVFYAALIINTSNNITQVYLSIFISICLLSLFYYIFIYNILLINASLYKRYSDSAKEENAKIREIKNKVYNKIDKDSLTGIYNRRYIISTLEELCRMPNTSFSVLFVDVNGLKSTNDIYGHEAGDRLIVKIGNAITKSIRDDDFAARIGGDEFLVILSETNEKATSIITKRILSNIAIQNETEEFLISASIGSLLVDEKTKLAGVTHILSMADELMRTHKERFYKARMEADKL